MKTIQGVVAKGGWSNDFKPGYREEKMQSLAEIITSFAARYNLEIVTNTERLPMGQGTGEISFGRNQNGTPVEGSPITGAVNYMPPGSEGKKKARIMAIIHATDRLPENAYGVLESQVRQWEVY
ncbi:hypothetical protein CMO83_03005 [Candidatus Woesearchaeota archaeon]|jgi:hypothetical protein|nr:hypothetical protein [Candidatus Woesearchaeota archaeon]|tara:strand:+ start:7981 stop:8352 length:372 start_codon:yes stop_codon:yes gene_type:complete